VQTVINYEAPQTYEIYLHRVGRTARAGRSGRACTLAGESDRKVVKAAVKNARAQRATVVSRALDVTKVDGLDIKLQKLTSDIEEILREEREEKQLAQADLQLTKVENTVKYQCEIVTKPRRTWFESEKEKRAAKNAGRAELNGPESVKENKGRKRPSGKEKKRLDDRRERIRGNLLRERKGNSAQPRKGKKARK